MKKPVEAIERIRGFTTLGAPWNGGESYADLRAILAYLDSQEWPADLTRERMEHLLRPSICNYQREKDDALRRLAELAPKREKRKVNLWINDESKVNTFRDANFKEDEYRIANGWRKVGEAEIDA